MVRKWYGVFCQINPDQYFGVAAQEEVQLYLQRLRGVAQSGSALAWGVRGRGFESRRPDNDCEPFTLGNHYQSRRLFSLLIITAYVKLTPVGDL